MIVALKKKQITIIDPYHSENTNGQLSCDRTISIRSFIKSTFKNKTNSVEKRKKAALWRNKFFFSFVKLCYCVYRVRSIGFDNQKITQMNFHFISLCLACDVNQKRRKKNCCAVDWRQEISTQLFSLYNIYDIPVVKHLTGNYGIFTRKKNNYFFFATVNCFILRFMHKNRQDNDKS